LALVTVRLSEEAQAWEPAQELDWDLEVEPQVPDSAQALGKMELLMKMKPPDR
jgi:hypothetical protein